MYIMTYLLNKNKLPWSDFHKEFQDQGYDFDDFLNQRLDIEYTKKVFKLIPRSLRQPLKKILTLKFEETPPYDYLIDKITRQIQKEVKFGPDMQPITHVFEWAQNHASRLRENIKHQEKQSIVDSGEAKSHNSLSSVSMFQGKSFALAKQPINGQN